MKKYPEIKQQAIKLRKEGYSYAHISQKTGRAKSTLYHWLAQIPYTPNEHTVKAIGRARARAIETRSKQKQALIKKIREEAEEKIGKLTNRDLFMLGIGLYIGEGTKSHGVTRIINADPAVINLAIRWFKECLGLKNDNFSLRIHAYPDTDIKRSIRFWSEATGLGDEHISKPQIDRRVNKKASKRGKLPYGTAHLTIKGSQEVATGMRLARKISSYMDIVTNK